MFVYQIKTKMHHIDAAGVMFFGHYFDLAHDAYEAFLTEISFSVEDKLQDLKTDKEKQFEKWLND